MFNHFYENRPKLAIFEEFKHFEGSFCPSTIFDTEPSPIPARVNLNFKPKEVYHDKRINL